MSTNPVQLIDAREHTLRLIAPISQLASEGSTVTVLGKDYGFTWLTGQHLPTSSDLVEGSYTGRLGDAGEFSLTFPNVAGPKGVWRDLFDPDLALQFIEIYRDNAIEFVGSIQRVEIDRGRVVVSGTDAFNLMRRVYERDRFWTAAPRDVWEHYTKVPVPLIADDFPGSSLAGTWTILGGGTATVAGGLCRSTSPAGNQLAGVAAFSAGFSSDSWRAVAVFRGIVSSTLPTLLVDVNLGDGVIAYGFAPNRIELQSFVSGTALSVATAVPTIPAAAGSVTMVLERQGRWLFGWVNGTFAGVLPVFTAAASTLYVYGYSSTTGTTLDIDSVSLTERQPFLIRGSVKGDYALPSSALPTGGLRGRYYNDADLQGLAAAARYPRLLSPGKASLGDDDVVTVIDTAVRAVMPVGSYVSARWFGAVYLRMDLGNYVFEMNHADGVRVWVGKTGWGDQLIDDWATGAGRLVTGTLTAASMGSKAGWYPIIVEHHHGTTVYGCQMKFTPPGTGYTDPGGTAIVASTKIIVPLTSLSPTGCFDDRLQGASAFDVVSNVAQSTGYQLWCEPKQLESGEFPGRLVPKSRVGSDRDVVLEVGDDDRDEPLFSPGVTFDSSDQALSLVGSGAGIPNGLGGQVSGEVTDLANIDSALFALEQFIDAGDIGFRDLLASRLSAELALRNTPWSEVRGTPRAQERLADTWPLSSTLSELRWRPGDGVRLRVPEISVDDTSPRQIVQVTRSFVGEGRTGTTVAFRQRPRSAGRSLNRLLRAAISPARNYQGQQVSLPGAYIQSPAVAAAGFSAYSIIALLPNDQVVRALLRITLNSTAKTLDVEINGTLRGTVLGGTWATVPVEVDITAYATQASTTDNRLYARLKNTGAGNTDVEFTIHVDVQR